MAPGQSSETRERPADEVERQLRDLPDLELLGLLRRSSNYTFLARLGPEPELLTVYKPRVGESPLWDFPSGTLYKREVAAYLLARGLGWPNIPPTVVRQRGPHGVGALQLWVEALPGRDFFEAPDAPETVWEEVALFDVVTNNADRKSGHCLNDEAGRWWVIDHGLTFHVETKLRTVIWDFAGRPLPDRLRGDLERATAELCSGELRAAMAELVSPHELASLERRLEAVQRPGWCYPQPGSGWSVPWPPV
ncbi:MAG TPA: hypothetical protein VF134_06265 [Candidatus Dormibacteraeota bacterium]